MLGTMISTINIPLDGRPRHIASAMRDSGSNSLETPGFPEIRAGFLGSL